ncbi:lysophospholipid acyltransferase family protein [Nocardia jejuensis]|uniref:lysophospholipid acyltransferase family protein n=1 Tax=Nocardia jejuensis TaxID=328049 RepID=UPI00083180CA|nr:1-acyl-sn-glycerol-3-phosphate acyltransferase [Nocardia jejuensis]
MERPEVILENSDAVYDFYRDHRQNPIQAKAAYWLLSRGYRPRISYAPGARERLRAFIAQGRPLLISINHLSQLDPYTVAATAWGSVLRPVIGRTRVLAKDELFVEDKQRRRIDMMGGIPVFRGKDHGLRAVNAAGQRMIDVCAERMARGDGVAVFPEGTCNLVDPAQVQQVGTGIGHIAFRAKKLGADPVLVSLGLSYGPRADPTVEPTKEQAKSASFYFGVPVGELPTKPAEVTRIVRDELQTALTGAVAAY